MSDFFDKIQAMDSTDKIFEEIKKLNERLFRINEGSPMYEQLQGMIEKNGALQIAQLLKSI